MPHRPAHGEHLVRDRVRARVKARGRVRGNVDLAGERLRDVADDAVDLAGDLERGYVVKAALLDLVGGRGRGRVGG